MNAHSTSLNLEKIVAGAQLPALPQSAVRLLELAQDQANGPAEFAAPIESDPGLAGQVLRFVNSSYFGFAREISSVKLALTLVGVRTIKNFALWSAVFSLMPNPRCGPFDLKGLWQDSLRRALFARALARRLGIREPEEPFAAALLQDMAIPLLAKEAPELYTKLLDARDQGRIRLSFLEEKVFGWTHADAASYMARQWNLPDEFAALIEHHQAVDRFATEPMREPGKLAVAMSALLPTIADPVWHECGLLDRYYGRMVAGGAPSLLDLLAQVDREFSEFAPVVKLPTPGKSLVDAFQEMTVAAV